MTDKTHQIDSIKKNLIAVISVLAFVVALCCVFITVGNKPEEGSVSQTFESETSVETSVSDDVVLENDVSEESTEPEVSEPVVLDPIAEPGYGIYVDGYFIAAFFTEEEAQNAILDATDNRAKELGVPADAENSFVNSISVMKGEFEIESFYESINNFLSDEVIDYSGSILPVQLSLKSVLSHSQNVVLEHETKKVYTDAMADGTTDVVVKGYDGEGTEIYEVICINGVETERNMVSLEITSEVIDEVIYVGTRSDGMSIAGVMNLKRPYDPKGYVITSYFGSRWGKLHKGLDIARNGGCHRDPAYAAADGVVVKASDTGDGYGNCVIIDHGNGVTTLYAHFDSCSVKVGDVVKAGDEVGKIGNTGNSYGAHLHFEVRVDNEPTNPLLFVDYE